MRKIYFLFAALIILTSNDFFGQCSLYPVSLSNRVSNSSLIIEGKVISQKSFWNVDRNYIYTSNLISINQVIKGSFVSPYLEVITEGGTVDLNKQVVEPSLQLDINDEGVFTLNSFNQLSQFGSPVFQTYADQQGFIKFNLSENSAVSPFKKYTDINNVYTELETILNINLPAFINPNSTNKFTALSSVAPAITSIAPTIITAGTSSILTINGSGFGATQGTSIVEFFNADDGGSTYIQPHSTQYVSWSNTQIQVMVPTKSGTTTGTAGTGPVRVTVGTPVVSSQTLTVNYGEINVLYTNTITTQAVFNTRHVDLNTMGGINWQMYTSFNANGPAKTSFLSAFQTWRCNTNINWLLGTTVTTNTIALDGVNVIRFDINTELPVGVLGRCSSYFSGCSFGPNVYFYVSELDICFDDPATSAITWNFGPAFAAGIQYDFESVAVHELGHGHQLSHVINNGDVMHWSIGQAVNKRTLNANNIAAGNDVMSRDVSAGICGKGSIVAITPSLCSVGSPTSAFNLTTNTVCVGQTVVLNSSSIGGPTNFSWTITGGSTTSSTLQNTSTTYATPGTYSITLLAINGIGSSSVTKTISVIALPSVVVTSTNVCSGNTATMSASGASSFTWNPGVLAGATQTFNIANTQIYTVTGSNGICSSNSTGTLTVISTPTVSVPNSTVCSGSTVLVTANGASSYTWNPGGLNGASQTYSPASAGVISVIGANGSCLNTKNFTLTLNPTPTVSAVASVSLICTGQTTTLTANGASSYIFNPGAIAGNPVSVSPTTNTTYTVSGLNNSCTGTSMVTVSVSLCTDLNNIAGNIDFKVFPNPTQGIVTMNFSNEFTGHLHLYNALGQLINSLVINETKTLELNFTPYPKGVYLINMQNADGKGKTIRVVID